LVICSDPQDSVLSTILDSNSDEEITQNIRNRLGEKQIKNRRYFEEPLKIPIVPDVNFETYAGRKFRLNSEEFGNISRHFFFGNPGLYCIRDLKRFEYVSDDGSLMFSDILFISEEKELVDKSLSCVKGMSRTDNLIMRGVGREYASNKREFERTSKEYSRRVNQKYVFMSAETMPKREKIVTSTISPNQARKLIKEGWTNEKILEKFDGVKKMQLAAYRAHITMGTYDRQSLEAKATSSPRLQQSNQSSKNIDPTEGILRRGIIVYDSNQKRLMKNADRINFGEYAPNLLNLINGFRKTNSLRNICQKRNGLYILNTYDQKINTALNLLLDSHLESPFFLNLLLLGYPSEEITGDIKAGKELGIKARTSIIEMPTPYLDPNHPVSLEAIIRNLI